MQRKFLDRALGPAQQILSVFHLWAWLVMARVWRCLVSTCCVPLHSMHLYFVEDCALRHLPWFSCFLVAHDQPKIPEDKERGICVWH
jgi:hypothetical protein